MNKMYKTKQFVLKYLQNFLVELIFIVIANDRTIVVKLTIYASYSLSQLSILCTYVKILTMQSAKLNDLKI